MLRDEGVLGRVFALVWPNYEPPVGPIPQQNRSRWRAWRAESGVELWGWFNASADQHADAAKLIALTAELAPSGWLVDIEGEWMKDAKLTTLTAGVRKTGLPAIASLAGVSAAHTPYDFRALDLANMDVDWQAYFDSGEGPAPADAVRELYASSFVIPGWEYRHRIHTVYGWGKVTDASGSLAGFDSYKLPGDERCTFRTRPREWGSWVDKRTLMKAGKPIGELMGRARYAKIRVTLDVTRGANDKHSPAAWELIAGTAKYPGASRRPISVYMAENASDEVLAAIAAGAP